MPGLVGLPRPFWVLFAGTFVNRVGGFALIFLAIYLTEARGLTPAQAGAVVAAYGIGDLCSRSRASSSANARVRSSWRCRRSCSVWGSG